MKIRSLVPAAAGVVVLAAAGWIVPHVFAQLPWDMVRVNLPYPVTVGEKTLPPGEYTIEQLRGTNDSPVLLIYKGDGTKFETSAMTIHTVDPNTPQDTTVSLHHIGDNYYFDKIWVEGKNYGYEIPLPKNVMEREKEATSVSVPAQSAPSATAAPAASDAAVPPPEVSAEPAPPPEPTPAAEPEAAAPAPTPAPEPQASPDTSAQQPATPPAGTSSANREKRPDDTGSTPSMPATSAGWLGMLLGGGTLSSAGLMLRRRKR